MAEPTWCERFPALCPASDVRALVEWASGARSDTEEIKAMYLKTISDQSEYTRAVEERGGRPITSHRWEWDN